MRSYFLLLLAVIGCSAMAQEINIIPEPASLSVKTGRFALTRKTPIVVQDAGGRRSADFLNLYLRQYYGFSLPVQKTPSKNAIRLYTRKFIKAPDKDAYSFESSSTGISIEGDTYAGTFYGIQTLIQLLPARATGPLNIPAVSIQDAPRFGYRGLMLDVGRHFFPVSFIKKYIDYLALHKLNYFHWHLTEDQGWRIEIKKYPRLTEKGAWRNGTITGRYPGKGNTNKTYGGYYTQEQVREIVRYAADRFITVIPEIEMPGHGSAAIAAYPELSCFPAASTKSYFPGECTWAGDTLGKQVQQTWGVFDDVFCAGKENTFRFLQDVIDELIPLFPGSYIHIGGDECPKTNWKKCPRCQQVISEKGLKDEHELQSYFITRMEKYINSKGRRIIGWDEILEGGLAPDATVMSWRGEQGGIEAARQQHDVIMSPTSHVYFDYSQSRNEDSVTIGGFIDLAKVYSFEPHPDVLTPAEAGYIRGAQANVWTEYITNPAKMEYMIFPRLAALSEVLWSNKEKKDWSRFEQKLPVQLQRYDLWQASYSRAFYEIKATVIKGDNNIGILWKLESRAAEDQLGYFSDTDTSVTAYISPVLVTGSGTFKGLLMRNGEVKGTVTQSFLFNKATGKAISLNTPPSPKYPGDGAFTLVNGVQNEKRLARSSEFLGFEGTDCEAIIDLGEATVINEIIVHTLEQKSSWIYFPANVDVAGSADGQAFMPLLSAATITRSQDKQTLSIRFASPVSTRYLKITLLNNGIIEKDQPGAGHKAWLFVDEIEVL